MPDKIDVRRKLKVQRSKQRRHADFALSIANLLIAFGQLLVAIWDSVRML